MPAELETPASIALTDPSGGSRAAPSLRPVASRDSASGSRLGGVLRRAPRTISRLCGRGALGLRAGWYRLRARGALARAPRPLRLCLGSGKAPIPGWANIDLDARSAIHLDLRYPIPLPDASVALIYSEHVIEHLELADGLALFRECRRVLAPDGVLRVATPDLAHVVRAYQGDWRAQDWVKWPGHEWIDSAALMLNRSFHSWGHQHLYDFDELTLRLAASGFTQSRRCAIGESATPELSGLETRADSLLIVEAWGGAARRKA